MSYESIVGGKLKLKGKALDVKSGKLKKKKKRNDLRYQFLNEAPVEGVEVEESPASGEASSEVQVADKDESAPDERQGQAPPHHWTAAEKRYYEQKQKLEAARLAKVASKSHREKIEDFNQYLANLSEHYDIPKVGPG